MPERHFLDFKAIKARIQITDLLARYQVSLVRVNQISLKGNCPLPTHSSSSKNTFFVNEAKSVWYCHSDSCRKNGQHAGGNTIDFVSIMEHCSVYTAAQRLEEWFPESESRFCKPIQPASIDVAARRHIGVVEAIEPRKNRPLPFALKDLDPMHPMIQERGISVGTARLFGVGFFPGKGSMAGRIVFPLHEVLATGTGAQSPILVGYAGRTTLSVSDANPKWLFGKGLQKSFVYGLDRCDPAKPFILCESLWAPLWFRENGCQAGALMGSEMSEEQERCLNPFEVITVAFDDDPRGIERAESICQRLRVNHRVLKARLIE